MENKPARKIVITTIIVLLVPIMSYTIFQVLQSDENEELIQSIYDRQLESILFSVNQHCWDMFSTWLSEVSSIATTEFDNFFQYRQRLKVQEFVDSDPIIAGAFLRFSSQYIMFAWEDAFDELRYRPYRFQQDVNSLIQRQSESLARNIELAREGYTKPTAHTWPMYGAEQLTLLLFPIITSSENAVIGGIFFQTVPYIEEVVGRKFNSMNEGDFIFGVRDNTRDELLYVTEEDFSGEFEKSTPLWILPDLALQIKLAGTTLTKISKSRTRTNLMLLLAVNIMLVFGIVYLLRNMATEMRLARMKTSFVANVSHELRTPVALIRMFAETLEMGRIKSDEKRIKYYRTILSESARLSQLINNILDFSKIESKKKDYHLAHGDVTEIVYQAVEMHRYHIEQNQFTLELDIEPDIPEIKMDSEAVTQAFVNLIDNAIKYSDGDKWIQINLIQDEKWVRLSVSDRGIGIPEQEQKKVFDKFYRVGGDLVHNTKGSGLGLALVKHIMQVHDGRVTIKSKVGEGSTFSLLFPKIEQPGGVKDVKNSDR